MFVGGTAQQYQYAENEISVTPSLSTNNYSYAFADSVNLTSYPFSYNNDFLGNVGGGLRLENLTYGVPANLSIRWLGNTYTGKVTLLNEYEFSIEWDNSGPVKINQSF